MNGFFYYSFQNSFKIDRNNFNSTKIINEKLTVIEGDKATITNKLLHTEIDNNQIAFVKYNITKQPQFGLLKLLNAQLNDVIHISPLQITQTQIEQNRVIYIHDDSENASDSFEFIVVDDNDNLIYKGYFQINIIMKNDNPPVRVIDKPFTVVVNGEKKLTGFDLKYIDLDIDCTPSAIRYSKKYIPNGEFYYVNKKDAIVEQFTQEDLDKERILFRHSGDEEGRAILWITDGQFYASGVLEIRASKPYIKIQNNTGLIVKMGESVIITKNNLSVETNIDVKSNR